MTRFVMAAAVLAALAAPAAANQKHDASIDQAAARILAAKIGGLRGGFAPDQRPEFVDPEAALPTGAVRRADSGWDRGLARAREPRDPAGIGF